VRAQVIEECEQAERSLGFSPAVRFTGPVDTLVGEEVAAHLLPVLRETLSNTARHAHAARADVDLAASASKVVLTVTDDGSASPPAAGAAGWRICVSALNSWAARSPSARARPGGPWRCGTCRRTRRWTPTRTSRPAAGSGTKVPDQPRVTGRMIEV